MTLPEEYVKALLVIGSIECKGEDPYRVNPRNCKECIGLCDISRANEEIYLCLPQLCRDRIFNV
jgi:hypothetical protein